MKVHIEGNLYLESDEIEFTVKKYGTPYINGKGKHVEPVARTWHFNSVQSACKHLVKMKLMESTATDLKEMLGEVEGIKKFIEERVAV